MTRDGGLYPSPWLLKNLGVARATRLEHRQQSLEAYIAKVPDSGSWVLHLPIPLASVDSIGASEELLQRLRSANVTDAFLMTFSSPDGKRFGFASDIFQGHIPPRGDDFVHFLLLDIHSAIGGFWLSHCWRTADLALGTREALVDGNIISAAACSRALLEGVAAFVVEGDGLIRDWSAFKGNGVPNVQDVVRFRQQFLPRLLQAIMGTRISELAFPNALKRTSVLTFLGKFARQIGNDVLSNYEWLCDAVHPSFGFGTTYTAARGLHKSGATLATDLRRRPDIAGTPAAVIEPTVAFAVADATVVSIDAFLAQAPRVLGFMHDFRLTSGLPEIIPSIQLPPATDDKAACPCGSGLGFSKCTHEWGAAAASPPADG